MRRIPAAATQMGQVFQRSICERPHDDAPRLVYADWLEESGYVEQAEYIRLSLWMSTCQGEAYEKKWDEAEYQCSLLYKARMREWIYPFGRIVARQHGFHSAFTFERGFAYRVRLPYSVFLPNAATLFSLQPITSVDIAISPYARNEIETELYNADLTSRGLPVQRVPGPIFLFLDRVGVPCTVRGSVARFDNEDDTREAMKLAPVAFGRYEAGLPELLVK
jgi:uncharacterized protein (TIGR02996 family)